MTRWLYNSSGNSRVQPNGCQISLSGNDSLRDLTPNDSRWDPVTSESRVVRNAALIRPPVPLRQSLLHSPEWFVHIGRSQSMTSLVLGRYERNINGKITLVRERHGYVYIRDYIGMSQIPEWNAVLIQPVEVDSDMKLVNDILPPPPTNTLTTFKTINVFDENNTRMYCMEQLQNLVFLIRQRIMGIQFEEYGCLYRRIWYAMFNREELPLCVPEWMCRRGSPTRRAIRNKDGGNITNTNQVDGWAPVNVF